MIRILFDGPPSHESGRFIEVENEKGESIRLGEWVEQGDYWVLQFPDNREVNADLLEALEKLLTCEDLCPLCKTFAKQTIAKAKA